MKFTQLRLAGFKSFVDPTDMRIEPGLTGIIGPNGCGKSNLLEAMRWVMGATSAKSLRGSGMEDVIFSGTDARPSRNHAEVVLTVDNFERRAPARFNDHDMLEVSRHIKRGGGSAYKVNGEDVRAKDVQLLFADAGTGANSAALVRQGQISELIAAKPQNRRRILEEAAGVSGLRARRHEAELRLKAAEGNLDRLQDYIDETAARHDALQRQSRQASRYRKLSASIRTLEAAVWLNRWRDADAAVRAARQSLEDHQVAAEKATRIASEARTQAEILAAQREPARMAEAEASAGLRRLERERDKLERDKAEVTRAIVDLENRLRELAAAAEREETIVIDARTSWSAANGEMERIDAASELEKDVLAAAETAAIKSDEVRRTAEQALDVLSSAAAEHKARLESARREAETLHARIEQIGREIEAARDERDSLRSSRALLELGEAEEQVPACDLALEKARNEQTAATDARLKADAALLTCKETLRDLRADRDALQRETEALERILATTLEAGINPALDSVRARPGYEHALAAALGDDLDASLNDDALRFWRESDCSAGSLPGGCVPLSDHVDAPPALKARLDAVGVIKAESAARALGQLLPGQKLVTREGDVWRWDGLVARSDAPSAAVARLEQRNRLDAIAGSLEDGALPLKAADQAVQHAEAARAQCVEAETQARAAIEPAEKAARKALETISNLREAAAKHASRAQSLDEIIARLETERDTNTASFDASQTILTQTDTSDGQDADIAAARVVVDEARIRAADTRAALESARRESELRRQRSATLKRDRDAWKQRCDAASARITDIVSRTDQSVKELEDARARPAVLDAALDGLAQQIKRAEATALEAREQAASTEESVKEADRLARGAESDASTARESKAANEAHLAGAQERLAETTALLQDTTGSAPGALVNIVEDGDLDTLSVAELERRLSDSKQSRDRLGAVNLRAEEEAEELATKKAEMVHERDDLLAAIVRLRKGVDQLSREGRARLLDAFEIVDAHFRSLFGTLFDGGAAELRLTENDDPLEAGLEIFACPPGKKLETMSLMSGGEQALTASALIFAVFLSNPAPVCVLDEVDAPLDDANVDRYCRLLDEMRRVTETRFLVISHNPLTMSRMDRLYGVTMAERGVSQLVSVDLVGAEQLIAAE